MKMIKSFIANKNGIPATLPWRELPLGEEETKILKSHMDFLKKIESILQGQNDSTLSLNILFKDRILTTLIIINI